MTRMSCPDCEMLSINGIPCHEIGCPNMGARWDADSGEWIRQRDCFECGCTVDADDPCCQSDEEPIEHDTVTLPAHWASALINDDTSGLDETEIAHLIRAVDKLLSDGWQVVSTVDDSERFTWSYKLYDTLADCEGGTVLDYVILRS